MGFDWKGKLEDLKDRIGKVKDKMLGDDEVQQPELLEGNIAVIHDTVVDLWDAFQDGFDLSDIGAVAKAVVEFVKVAEDIKDQTGKEKREFVQDAALAVYRIWDPNIPIVWGSMERALERKAVHLVSGAVIDGCLSLVRKLKGHEEADSSRATLAKKVLDGGMGEEDKSAAEQDADLAARSPDKPKT